MTSSSKTCQSSPEIIQWLLDTRPLWPVPRTGKPKEDVEQLKTVASRALSLLSADEQAAVLRYYHIKDAKMSLGSHLLKHLIITKYGNVPWSQSDISRDANGKPCFKPQRASSHQFMDFNVSHQAGIVSLIAVIGGDEKIDVGTDLVCVNERLTQDHNHIDKDGFFAWVDMHADVFAPSELNLMKLGPVEMNLGGEIKGFCKDTLSRCQWRNETFNVDILEEGRERSLVVDSNSVIDWKLRRFYTCWCLRESYVKMTGEALLAPWLKELEILGGKSPRVKAGVIGDAALENGEVESAFNIIFEKRKVTNVRMELTALGENYIVGASIRPRAAVGETGSPFGRWEHLDLVRDVLEIAESSL